MDKTYMDFHHQNPIMGDPLHVIYFLGCTIYHSRLVKIVLWILVFVYIAFSAAQICYMVSAPETIDIANYGALLLQMLWVIMSTFPILTKNYLIEDTMSVIELWAVDSADEETKTRILKESKFLNAFACFNSTMGLIWATAMIYPNQRDIEHSFPAFLFNKWSPQYDYFLGYAFNLTSFVTSFTMVALGYQFIYGTQHLKFQMYILNKFIEGICHDFVPSDDGDLFDKAHQMEIKFRLKVLVKKHQDIIRCKTRGLANMKGRIVPLSFGGLLIGLSLFLDLLQITEKNSPPILLLRAGSFSIIAASTFCSVIIAGQTFESESENIYNALISTNWYQWTEDNRKTLTIMLCNSISPISMKFTDSFVVNFELGMGICKAVYSAASVFYNMK